MNRILPSAAQANATQEAKSTKKQVSMNQKMNAATTAVSSAETADQPGDLH
jgi:hypothetical protein